MERRARSPPAPAQLLLPETVEVETLRSRLALDIAYALFQRNQPLGEAANQHFIGAKALLEADRPLPEFAQQRGFGLLNPLQQRLLKRFEICFCGVIVVRHVLSYFDILHVRRLAKNIPTRFPAREVI